MSTEHKYPQWKTHRLAARVKMYAGYVGCGCGEKHDPRSTGCARADFTRLAQVLYVRVRP